MERIRIDGTALHVSRFAFGTASLHHALFASERESLLRTAFDAGFCHFDASPYYGQGIGEIAIGRALKSYRPSLTIATKIGLYPRLNGSSAPSVMLAWMTLGRALPSLTRPQVDWSVHRARTSLRESLIRLRTDYIDILFLHEPVDALVSIEEFKSWLESEREAGVIRYWGVAGEAQTIAPWVAAGNPLAQIVQTRDSLSRQEANFVTNAGRALQFTYGYFSSSERDASGGVQQSLKRVLSRNPTGSVVVFTHRKERVKDFAEAAS